MTNRRISKSQVGKSRTSLTCGLRMGMLQSQMAWVCHGVEEVTEMKRVRWQERIVIAPDLHHGDPCIKGTRIPVAMIVGSLADGMTPGEVQDAYPQLTLEDIQAALAYAAEVIHQDVLVLAPLPA
jgi:uncharacterized protein (DUF433 family)